MDKNNKCPGCLTINKELMWMEIKLNKVDTWVCLYCYNGGYTVKQVERIRNKKL